MPLKTKKVIKRLSAYKKALVSLNIMGFKKVFSDNLADAIDVKSTQVRKDFSLLNITGKKRGGYVVSDLIKQIDRVLGKNELEKVVIVGYGHLGSALINYAGFERENIKIVAGFDISQEKVTDSGPVPIYNLSDLKNYIKKHKIIIGIIAVPLISAQEIMTDLISAGIKGVLNFSSLKLKSQDNCIVKNMDIALELENLVYLARSLSKTS